MARSTRTRKTRTSTADRAAKAAALRTQLEEWKGNADPALVAMALARFGDGYSERNAMLIAMQCPGATDVDGFKAWISRGRCVRKGEHGIQILAPAGQGRDQVTTDSGKPETVSEWTAPDYDPSAPGIEGGSRPRQFFRIAYVFDIAQTDELTTEQPGPASEHRAELETARTELEEALDEVDSQLADMDA